MKNLLQRSLAVMLALVMAVSTPAAGLSAYAAPSVSENSTEVVTEGTTEVSTVEEISTVDEILLEENSSEVSTEEASGEEQSSEEASVEEPTTDTIEVPSAEEPTTDTIEVPSAEEPTTDTIEVPSTEEPSSEEISMEESTTEETTSEEVTTEESQTTEISTEETTTEVETEETTTEDVLTPELISVMEANAPVDLSTLARVDFDCSSSAFTAEVTVSEDKTLIHHDSYDKETNYAEYYSGHTFYTDSDTASITITPDEGYYQYSDQLSITKTNSEGEPENYTLSPSSTEDNSYTYTLELTLAETYAIDLSLTERYRTVSLDTVDAPHADILVETDSVDNCITPVEGTKNKYSMDCAQTDSFTFAIKNSADYSYTATYKGVSLTPDTEALEGYTVYTLTNDDTSAETLLPAENTIVITEEALGIKLNLYYNINEVDITVSNADRVLAFRKEGPGFTEYRIVSSEPITLTVKAKENCSVDSIGLTIGEGEETPITLDKKGSYTFKPNAGNIYNFNVTSTADYVLDKNMYGIDGSAIKPKNKTYTLSPGGAYGFQLLKGTLETDVDRIEIIPVSTGSADDFQKRLIDVKTYIIPLFSAAGNTYTINVYKNISNGSETQEQKLGSYKVAVAPVITDAGLTITGAKVKNGTTTITQEANTIKEYKLKLSSKQKNSSLDCLTAISSDETVASAEIMDDKLILTTKAKTAAELEAKNSVTVSIYDTENYDTENDPIEGRHVKTVTVKLTKSTLEDMAAPSLKLVSATDTTLTVKITAPKKVNLTPAEGVLHYVLFAEPADASVSGSENPYGVQSVEYWIPAEKSTVTIPIQVIMGKWNGYSNEGTAVDFKVSATMINTTSEYNGYYASGSYDAAANDYKSTDAAVAGSEKIFSTRTPAYATKLTVKQKKKAVYISDIVDEGITEPVSIATVSCDKNETFSHKEGISYSVMDITADENIAKLYLREYNGTIYLNGYDSAGELTGKHTIQVTAPGPDNGKNLSKTFTLEVKDGISYIKFVMSESMYKTKGKASTMKPTNLYAYSYDDSLIKNPKLNWSLKVFNDTGDLVPLEEAKDHYLYGYLTINKKNGTVTLKKNFVVDENNANRFYVYATPANEPNSSVDQDWEVQITPQKQEVDRLMILSHDDDDDSYHIVAQNNSSVTAAELEDTGVCALKKGAPVQSSYTSEEFDRYFMDTYSYSVKSNKLLLIYGMQIYYATGTGKNVTLTASANDGSSWKVTLKGLNIRYAEDELGFAIRREYLPESYTVSSDDSVLDSDYLFIPSKSTISYSGPLMDELILDIGYLTPEGNIDVLNIGISDSDRYDFWNYQIKSKEGGKLLSAKDMTSKLKDLFLLQGMPEEYFQISLLQSNDVYFVSNMKATSIIELNDKTNKNKFTLTFKNTDYEQQPAAPKVTISNVYTDQAMKQTLKLTVDGYNAETSVYDSIKLNMNADGFKKSSTAITYYALAEVLELENLQSLSADGTVEYTMYLEDEFDLKPGTYKFTASFYKGDTPAAVKPATVTVKVQKRNAVKGSYKPTTKYTINTSKDGTPLALEDLVKQEIAFGGSFTGKDVEINGISTRTMKVNSVQMVNTKGKFNNFFDYFEWHDETGAFSLKDTLSQKDIDYLMNKTKDANGKIIKSDADRKCYVNYTVTYGMNSNGLPFEKTGTALVTINIK